MKISARNVIKGKITAINVGPVSTEVTVLVAPGIEIVSSITSTSARNLKLGDGTEVYAVIKASSVMIATD